MSQASQDATLEPETASDSASDSLASPRVAISGTPPVSSARWLGVRRCGSAVAAVPRRMVLPGKVLLAASGAVACAAVANVTARYVAPYVLPEGPFETRALAWLAGWYGLRGIKDGLFGAHPLGTLVPNNTIMRQFLSRLMPTRNGSRVDYEQTLNLRKTLPFIDKWNAEHPDKPKIGLFEIAIAAIMRANLLHPGLNRFVASSRLFNHHEFSLAFSAAADDSRYTAIRSKRLVAIAGESFEELVGRIHETKRTKVQEKNLDASEREMHLLGKLPESILDILVPAYCLLERNGFIPKCLLINDPLQSSIYFANLGSVHPTEMRNVKHHLYETGTISLFACMCSAQLTGLNPSVRINWTFDERVMHGRYCTYPLIEERNAVENPEILLQPLTAEIIAQSQARDHADADRAFHKERRKIGPPPREQLAALAREEAQRASEDRRLAPS